MTVLSNYQTFVKRLESLESLELLDNGTWMFETFVKRMNGHCNRIWLLLNWCWLYGHPFIWMFGSKVRTNRMFGRTFANVCECLELLESLRSGESSFISAPVICSVWMKIFNISKCDNACKFVIDLCWVICILFLVQFVCKHALPWTFLSQRFLNEKRHVRQHKPLLIAFTITRQSQQAKVVFGVHIVFSFKIVGTKKSLDKPMFVYLFAFLYVDSNSCSQCIYCT